MYRNSRLAILLPILLAAAVVLGLLLGRYLGRNTPEAQLRNLVEQLTHPTNKLAYTLSLIETEYVDSVSMDSLSEQVIPLLMEELDPHSVYIPKSEMEAVNEPLQGEFDGIGVVFNMAPDTVIVLNVIPSGPSDKAGVKAGDRIIRINDSLVAGQKIPNNEIVKRLRGKRGTQVKLSLERQGIAEPVEVEVTRGAIPIKSLEAAFMLPDSIGYIKLSQFAITSHNELITALNNLKAQGMKRLIFDLRGNPGGFLDQAIRIANEFLPADKLIVYTEDRNHNRTDEMSDGNGTIQELPLAVLIDEFSASSSEILAGALQDNDRGTIIGRRSFGKGLVQRQIPYPDGSALRLTVARYYTPTGRSIQKPYTNGDALGYEEDLWNRYRHNEFFSADSIHFNDSLRKVTPGGKVVYGGGGIMPDLFVPVDTTDVTRYFLEVSGRNILFRYTLEYADRHRDALNAVKTIPELQALLDADKELMNDFIRYAARNGVQPDYKDIARSRKLIEAQRIAQRTNYDIEMLNEVGICKGIENYSAVLSGRAPGSMPTTLLDYFPDDFLLFVDESHVTLPQVRAMYGGDYARKKTLVEYGFRLPSAFDNRPLKFEEVESKLNQMIFVSATPGEYERKNSTQVAQQVIRPTGLLDPLISVRPVEGQVTDLLGEINARIERHERVLVTTLTKKMAEDLTDYFTEQGIKVKYMHHEVDTFERMEIIKDLRLGTIDVVVGINLLREGLDLPEVSLVAILDADKEGFLRSETSLIQTIGRAARNAEGMVIMYADVVTDSMERAITETERRRAIQMAYNAEHGIVPKTIVKAIPDSIEISDKAENARMNTRRMGKLEREAAIDRLTREMKEAAKLLEFEHAAFLRDQIDRLRRGENPTVDSAAETERKQNHAQTQRKGRKYLGKR